MRVWGQVALLAYAATGLAAPAAAEVWQVGPTSVLTFSEGATPVYRFECGAADVAVSQFGVTRLLDIQTNKPVADVPGSVITPGASFMALATDKVEPNLVPASATANAVKGWDLTIRLRKDDPSFRSLARAGMVSLFTTGFTRAVALDKADRKLLAGFVKQCGTS